MRALAAADDDPGDGARERNEHLHNDVLAQGKAGDRRDRDFNNEVHSHSSCLSPRRQRRSSSSFRS
jgi:hypothetical protein